MYSPRNSLTYSPISIVPRYNPWNVNLFLFNISNKNNINNQYAMKCGYNMHTCNHVEQECVRTKFKNKLNILERYQIIIFYFFSSLIHIRTFLVLMNYQLVQVKSLMIKLMTFLISRQNATLY